MLTVTNYELSPTIDSNYEQNVARGVYCTVYFTVTNVGTEPGVFPYLDLRVTRSDGRTYNSDTDAIFNLVFIILEVGIPNLDELQPGLSYDTAAAFDIPPTATGINFTTSEEVFVFALD